MDEALHHLIVFLIAYFVQNSVLYFIANHSLCLIVVESLDSCSILPLVFPFHFVVIFQVRHPDHSGLHQGLLLSLTLMVLWYHTAKKLGLLISIAAQDTGSLNA